MSTALLDLSSLIIDGQNALGSHADVLDALVSLTIRETITGASSLEMQLSDPHRTILRSSLLSEGSNVKVDANAITLAEKKQLYGLRGATCVLDGAGFELCAIKKAGSLITLTFEDMAVAALRRRTGPKSVAAGTMTRAEFCASLIREVGWIKVAYAPGAKSQEQLARGSQTTATNTPSLPDATGITGATPTNVVSSTAGLDTQDRQAIAAAAAQQPTSVPVPASASLAVTATALTTAAQKEDLEDTWTACGRIMGAIGWRTMARRGAVTLAPDSWLLTHAAASYTLGEGSPGVDLIDVDWDVGKPAATATLQVWAGSTDLAAGSPVTLTGMGPCDGPWLVESISRTLATKLATVTAIRPQPQLVEPTDASSDGTGVGGLDGYAGALATPIPDSTQQTGSENSGPGHTKGEKFVQYALAQRGKAYVGGTHGPNSFDCSGLVQAAAASVGVSFPAPVSSQSLKIVNTGNLTSVAEALRTRGAVVWKGTPGVNGGMSGSDHIGISLGNGQVMQALGRAYGCGVWPSSWTNWAGGGIVPGVGPA